MANAFKNTSLVSRYVLKSFINSMVLIGKVDRQLEKTVSFMGSGGTINIRRPVLFEGSTGAVVAATEDIEEGTVPVVLNKRRKVVFSLSSEDFTLSVENANERYFEPAGRRLAQYVESDIADAAYKGFTNFVGTPGTAPSTYDNVAEAMEALDVLGVPNYDRCAFYDPAATRKLSGALTTVFTQPNAKKALERATIGMMAGFEVFMSQSLKIHTVGGNWDTGTPLVAGAGQNTTYALSKDTQAQTLTTDGWSLTTAAVKQGDKFTIADVYSVNRETGEDTGNLQVFTVNADGTSDGAGLLTLNISPPIITSGPYRTVTAAPADNAVLTCLSGAEGSKHRQNIAFQKTAITLAMAQLFVPESVVKKSRINHDGISIRVVQYYDGDNDKEQIRFDILYGVKVQNGAFGVVTTG